MIKTIEREELERLHESVCKNSIALQLSLQRANERIEEFESGEVYENMKERIRELSARCGVYLWDLSQLKKKLEEPKKDCFDQRLKDFVGDMPDVVVEKGK